MRLNLYEEFMSFYDFNLWPKDEAVSFVAITNQSVCYLLLLKAKTSLDPSDLYFN